VRFPSWRQFVNRWPYEIRSKPLDSARNPAILRNCKVLYRKDFCQTLVPPGAEGFVFESGQGYS
jgi:hypothetical protein